MIMKLGMEQYALKLYKVYITDDPELTLTYFKAMSKFAKLIFEFTVAPDIRIIGQTYFRTCHPRDIPLRKATLCSSRLFIVSDF